MRYHDDEKLRALAADIIEGKVVTSNEVPKDLIPMVFMPLALSNPTALDKMKEDKVVVIYERIATLGGKGRSINGFPMFFSFNSLTEDDWAAFKPIYEKMKAAIDLAKAGGA